MWVMGELPQLLLQLRPSSSSVGHSAELQVTEVQLCSPLTQAVGVTTIKLHVLPQNEDAEGFINAVLALSL